MCWCLIINCAITKMISVTLLLDPGLGLALSECKQLWSWKQNNKTLDYNIIIVIIILWSCWTVLGSRRHLDGHPHPREEGGELRCSSRYETVIGSAVLEWTVGHWRDAGGRRLEEALRLVDWIESRETTRFIARLFFLDCPSVTPHMTSMHPVSYFTTKYLFYSS